MAEYKLANGGVITDEEIDRICAEFETPEFEEEPWKGHVEHIQQGSVAASDEPLASVKMPKRFANRTDSPKPPSNQEYDAE